MPGANAPDPEYVAARRVLLDALEALGTHRKAVVLGGAQAIYMQVGEGDLAVSPYTTDGDLAIDPRELDDEPELAPALRAAGFDLAVRPGSWSMSDVQIDLLVPASMGGPGRRGARLGPHGNEVARKVSGLEAAVVEHALMRVSALDPADDRAFDIQVAGVAALLVAKLHKISERKGDEARRQATWPKHLQSSPATPSLARLRYRRASTCETCSRIATPLAPRWRCTPAWGSRTSSRSRFRARRLLANSSAYGLRVRMAVE